MRLLEASDAPLGQLTLHIVQSYCRCRRAMTGARPNQQWMRWSTHSQPGAQRRQTGTEIAEGTSCIVSIYTQNSVCLYCTSRSAGSCPTMSTSAKRAACGCMQHQSICRVHERRWQLSGSAAAEGTALDGAHAPAAPAHCVGMQCTILLFWLCKTRMTHEPPNIIATAEAWHNSSMQCARARSGGRQHNAEAKRSPDSRPY